MAFAAVILALLTLVQTSAQQTYRPGVVVVVYRNDVSVAADRFDVAPEQLRALQNAARAGTLHDGDVPHYTNDLATNRVLLSLGVARSERLFVATHTSNPMLQRAYLLSIAAPVRQAVAQLRRLTTVVYASPDWYVTPQSPSSIRTVPAAAPTGRT